MALRKGKPLHGSVKLYSCFGNHPGTCHKTEPYLPYDILYNLKKIREFEGRYPASLNKHKASNKGEFSKTPV